MYLNKKSITHYNYHEPYAFNSLDSSTYDKALMDCTRINLHKNDLHTFC